MAKERGDIGTSAVSSPVSGPSVSKGGGYTSFGDMFDGGGPGRSGGPFQGGGILSAIGNALTGNRGMGVGPEAGVGFAGYGYNDPSGNWVSAAMDMRNGGGPGRAGNTFMGGGMYSGLLNMMGVRPAGYNDMRMMPEQVEAFRAQNMNKGPKNPALAAAAAPAAPRAPMPNPRNMAVPMANNVANMATNDFIGLDRYLAAQPTVPAVRGVNAPLVSGDPNLQALRLYTGGY
jgi:hypothetical protein